MGRNSTKHRMERGKPFTSRLYKGNGRLRDFEVEKTLKKGKKKDKRKKSQCWSLLALWGTEEKSKGWERGEVKEWVSEESGRRDNEEGAVGVRKLISIYSRKTVKRHTDLKHMIYENSQILQVLSNVTFLLFPSCIIFLRQV